MEPENQKVCQQATILGGTPAPTVAAVAISGYRRLYCWLTNY
jgi:hypothetical protein